MTSFKTIKGEFPDFLEISRTLIFKASKNSEPSSKSKIRLFSNAATAVVFSFVIVEVFYHLLLYLHFNIAQHTFSPLT